MDEPKIGNLAGIVLVSSMEMELHAILAHALVTRHPETAVAMFTKFAEEPPPAGFVEQYAAELAGFVESLRTARSQVELARAEAESKALPKEQLN